MISVSCGHCWVQTTLYLPSIFAHSELLCVYRYTILSEFLFFPINSILTLFFVLSWKVPHRFMCLNIWSPMGDFGYVNLRQWNLTERSDPLDGLLAPLIGAQCWMNSAIGFESEVMWTKASSRSVWTGITSVCLSSFQMKFNKKQTLRWSFVHKTVIGEELENWPL